MVPRATIDFETRSACSLRKHGAWRYSLHPSTEVLCLAFRLPSWVEGRVSLWHPAFPHLGIAESDNWSDIVELVDWIFAGGLLEAHNVWFEYCIWTNILQPQFDFPPIPAASWRCSAAKASAHALPRGLDDVVTVLKLSEKKDAEGHKLMLKLSKPRKSWKKERDRWEQTGETPPAILWHESEEQFARLWTYCQQDVRAEEGVSQTLPDLSPEETQVFLMDMDLNRRGFQIDSKAVSSALGLIGRETRKLNGELQKLTRGKVKKATQRAQMIDWFKTEGLTLYDTQKETLDRIIEEDAALETGGCSWATDLSPKAKRALQIVRALGRSSTAKYQSMQDWMDLRDYRVRGGLLYHGATTGRWSGKGVQPHNFVKGTIKDQEGLWAGLRAGKTPEGMGMMEALANALRGAIVAAAEHVLYVADYAAIEARVVLWLAGDEAALDIFRRHEDIYLEMASAIYDRPCTKDDKDERALGKIAVLGLGYQMGASKFQTTCAKFGITIDDALAQTVVDTYRERFSLVKQMWWDQEDAAIAATKRAGKAVTAGRVTWIREGRFLYCVLPSGRRLSYPDPQVKQRATPWGAMKDSLTFMGVNAYNHQWQRQTTYGGMLVENITQAVARDLMAEAMLRCEATGVYQIVLTVHDEIVAEAPALAGNVQEFEGLMAACPEWAEGCPVAAEGWTGTRYRK